jgi:STE24 endopeptidase
LWTSKVWFALGTAALLLLAAVLAGTLLKSSSGSEALQYFEQNFLTRAASYQRSAILVSVARQLIFWGALSAVAAIVWKQFPSQARAPLLPTVAYLALIVLLLSLLTFPLDYYRGFILEHRFGLSLQSFSAWLADYAKNFSISFLLTVLALCGLHLLMARLPGRWWPAAGIFVALFLVLSTYLYPLIIDPLFYRFTTLEDEEMHSSIIEMSKEAGIEVDKVLVADASRRTAKVNAYFTGMGRTKRIVIFDNLLTGFSKEEILAVIAHEMGHWKHSHIFKGIILGAAGIFLGFFLLQKLLDGMRAGAGIRSLTLALLYFSLFSFVSLPVQNAFSRAFERQADLEAIRLTGNPRATVSLEQNLAKANLADVDPHPFVKFVLYTHPPVMERIELAIREAES